MSRLGAIVMAAGQGTRMRSRRPKVLHEVCGRPLVFYPVHAALSLGAEEVCVVVSEQTAQAIAESLLGFFPPEALRFEVQREFPGTGGAARSGLAALSTTLEQVLVLNGDLPLIGVSDLLPLQTAVEAGRALAFLTFEQADPTGYGRVVRDPEGRILEIREHRDLRTPEQRAIRELNAGTYLTQREPFVQALAALEPTNAQGEYYLTDIVRLIAARHEVVGIGAGEEAAQGVNDRTQLRQAEARMQQRLRLLHEAGGVTVGPDVLLDFGVELASDVKLEQGVRLRGRVKVGEGTLIDVGCVIEDSTIGADVEIKPYSVITQSRVGDRCSIGPFAHLRPESEIEEDAKIGNFVETKGTRLGRGSKANHLAYLGDADVGEQANVGAGVIVCNYDGFMKRRTTIGRGVFVGSDSQLIAPVTLGDGAYVATGTTVCADVPAGALAIGRTRQVNKDGYAAPLRERLASQAKAEKDAGRRRG